MREREYINILLTSLHIESGQRIYIVFFSFFFNSAGSTNRLPLSHNRCCAHKESKTRAVLSLYCLLNINLSTVPYQSPT